LIMAIRIFQVDAFTGEPFAGNPAAVCLLPEVRDDVWMQNFAGEMNLSETAFLVKQEDGFDLRWFTPTVEVALCGHATLASAHTLWESGTLAAGEQASFHTKSGLLTAEQKSEWIELNFPATPDQPITAPPRLVEALGVSPRYVGKTKFDYIIEVDNEQTIRSLKPDFAKLRELKVRGVMVTSRATTAGYDFVSRFFAPGSGIDEDPVTGSAHCCLTPYWSNKIGKNELMAYQASKRGGALRVRVEGDRVFLGGRAVTIFRGELADSL
jgi:PhzF family phenazine biosynthesis protein